MQRLSKECQDAALLRDLPKGSKRSRSALTLDGPCADAPHLKSFPQSLHLLMVRIFTCIFLSGIITKNERQLSYAAVTLVCKPQFRSSCLAIQGYLYQIKMHPSLRQFCDHQGHDDDGDIQSG